ncbi:Dbl homology domain-containing protein, partial [Vararia minispora EC-137]
SKRHHALLELLSSERAHASDLALVRELYIPAALGACNPPHPFPLTPPASSSSSGRTLSTASDEDSSAPAGPPMTPEDVRIVFGNIADIALFADSFSDRLEGALGDVIDGGRGHDRVGSLFIEVIPRMEREYTTYITHHPVAAEYLSKLPQTPALTAYLSRARSSAAAFSHAWDLPSLLIKPVQRLLKYPLLLQAVLDDTPTTHPDHDNLRRAREMMSTVSHTINDAQRRLETVRDVLANGGKTPDALLAGLPKRSMLLVRGPSGKGKAPMTPAENEEAAAVAKLEAEITGILAALDALKPNATDWADGTHEFALALSSWARGFGKITGLTAADGGSEAYDAFLAIADGELARLSVDASARIIEELFPLIARLHASAAPPRALLDALHALAPSHHALLHHNAAKGKPDKALLDASTAYTALRQQLALELPTFVELLRAGGRAAARVLVGIQAGFYADARARWRGLWDALRVDGERNAGAEETMRVWRGRVEEVEREAERLRILRPEKLVPPARTRTAAATAVRPGLGRRRSGSRKVGGAPASPLVPVFPSDDALPTLPPAPLSVSTDGAPTRLRVSSKWLTARAKYTCAVVHACEPPAGAAYYGLPFFRLRRGERYEVLKEAGHPSVHAALPLYVDDGDDCLLLARDGGGSLGWVLASFLYP